MQVNQANYPAVKANLEAAGFTNLPAESAIAWDAPLPFSINGTLNYKVTTVQASSVQLLPNT